MSAKDRNAFKIKAFAPVVKCHVLNIVDVYYIHIFKSCAQIISSNMRALFVQFDFY